MIGGHSQKDGGFTILPVPEQRSIQLAATMRVYTSEMSEWIAAAEALGHTLSLIAGYGANLMLIRELRDAEARYDQAKAAAVQIMTDNLTPTKG